MIGWLDFVIIINNRGGEGGLDGVEKIASEVS